MKTMPVKRSLAVTLLTASTLVAVGCTAARKTSAPLESATDPVPKKEYQWKDMSQGKSIFQNAKPTPDQ